jgi:hypothetical protein
MKEINEQISELEKKINDPDLCFGTASVWTRCTGYYRAVENFNWGKRREYADRLEYQPFGAKEAINKEWIKKILHGENE